MAKTFKSEDLRFLPAGTRCAKCYKNITQGLFQEGMGFGLSFNCKECYLENKSRLEKLGIKNGH